MIQKYMFWGRTTRRSFKAVASLTSHTRNIKSKVFFVFPLLLPKLETKASLLTTITTTTIVEKKNCFEE